MRRNGFARLVLFALIITAFYIAFIGTRNQNSNSNNRSPIQAMPPAPAKGPESMGHPGAHGRRFEHADRGFDSSAHVSCSSEYFSNWEEPQIAACAVRIKNGYPVPDPQCTPGGINPTITSNVLRDPQWRTRSVRNCDSSESEKHIEYRWYNIQKPRINSERNQVCELDHLVPLELGGADGLGNIWPQCGPDDVTLDDRFFKRKDHVENYLAAQVRDGGMSLATAQRGIASDWTQYLGDAERWCKANRRC